MWCYSRHIRMVWAWWFLAALAALYLALVSDWVSAAFEFWLKESLLTLEALHPFDWSDVWTKRQKDKKTKIRKEQKETLILWCQGSFAPLRCFKITIDIRIHKINISLPASIRHKEGNCEQQEKYQRVENPFLKEKYIWESFNQDQYIW